MANACQRYDGRRCCVTAMSVRDTVRKMILIDTESVGGWCHLVAGSIEELHEFAEVIGLNRCWFQNKRKKNQPHYDVRGNNIRLAISHGAVRVCRKELFMFLSRTYQ